jgi:hypothetical protein
MYDFREDNDVHSHNLRPGRIGKVIWTAYQREGDFVLRRPGHTVRATAAIY